MGRELVASTEAPREKETGQSIRMQTEPLVPAWLQKLSAMAEHTWLVQGLRGARLVVGAGWRVTHRWA